MPVSKSSCVMEVAIIPFMYASPSMEGDRLQRVTKHYRTLQLTISLQSPVPWLFIARTLMKTVDRGGIPLIVLLRDRVVKSEFSH